MAGRDGSILITQLTIVIDSHKQTRRRRTGKKKISGWELPGSTVIIDSRPHVTVVEVIPNIPKTRRKYHRNEGVGGS